MTLKRHFDAIIIGAGQSGAPLATALAKAGHNTALIERKHVGGTCINRGCTPTKTMAASARVAYLVRRAADYGVKTGPVSIEMQKIRQRKRNIVKDFRSGSQNRLENTEGLKLFRGEAAFTGPHTLEVRPPKGRSTLMSADKIFINTGARPAIPPIEGLDKIPYLDSTSIMELETVPEHLLVIGGGYVGLEFAQMFRRFGATVSIIQRSPQLLPREDADVAAEVKSILEEDGIEVLLKTEATAVKKKSSGTLEIALSGADGDTTRSASHLLIATGRKPNTDSLNPKATGIELDGRGYIAVNGRLETSVENIYALGDVKGGPAFTHISYDDFRVLRKNILEDGEATIAGRLIPYTVYIDPQLGRVGLSVKEARQQNYNIKIAKMPMSHVARALEVDETRGFMKAVINADNDQLLGCAILGIEGGEVATVLQMAMIGKLPYQKIRDGIFAHPTLAESLNNLFLSLEA